MSVPGHYLRRPAGPGDEDLLAFERLFAEQVAPGTGQPIRYELTAPKWQLLCWMTQFEDVVLHGSNSSSHGTVQPRPADDVTEFGAQDAVYGASDGLWPMYFAIADRTVVTSLVNACVHLADARVDPRHYYFFSIGPDDPTREPWVSGTVYVLPRDTFSPEPDDTWLGRRCAPTQWVSPVPVSPLARLDVTPDDFPFVHQVRRHDPSALAARAERDPTAFPWLDDDEDAVPLG